MLNQEVSMIIRIIINIIFCIASVYIAIKLDDYEDVMYYKNSKRVSKLVMDPMDAEWEFVRKQRRFEYIETTLEKIQEGFEGDPSHHSRGYTHFERCA
jgi:hypothetical protein